MTIYPEDTLSNMLLEAIRNDLGRNHARGELTLPFAEGPALSALIQNLRARAGRQEVALTQRGHLTVPALFNNEGRPTHAEYDAARKAGKELTSYYHDGNPVTIGDVTRQHGEFTALIASSPELANRDKTAGFYQFAYSLSKDGDMPQGLVEELKNIPGIRNVRVQDGAIEEGMDWGQARIVVDYDPAQVDGLSIEQFNALNRSVKTAIATAFGLQDRRGEISTSSIATEAEFDLEWKRFHLPLSITRAVAGTHERIKRDYEYDISPLHRRHSSGGGFEPTFFNTQTGLLELSYDAHDVSRSTVLALLRNQGIDVVQDAALGYRAEEFNTVYGHRIAPEAYRAIADHIEVEVRGVGFKTETAIHLRDGEITVDDKPSTVHAEAGRILVISDNKNAQLVVAPTPDLAVYAFSPETGALERWHQDDWQCETPPVAFLRQTDGTKPEIPALEGGAASLANNTMTRDRLVRNERGKLVDIDTAPAFAPDTKIHLQFMNRDENGIPVSLFLELKALEAEDQSWRKTLEQEGMIDDVPARLAGRVTEAQWKDLSRMVLGSQERTFIRENGTVLLDVDSAKEYPIGTLVDPRTGKAYPHPEAVQYPHSNKLHAIAYTLPDIEYALADLVIKGHGGIGQDGLAGHIRFMLSQMLAVDPASCSTGGCAPATGILQVAVSDIEKGDGAFEYRLLIDASVKQTIHGIKVFYALNVADDLMLNTTINNAQDLSPDAEGQKPMLLKTHEIAAMPREDHLSGGLDFELWQSNALMGVQNALKGRLPVTIPEDAGLMDAGANAKLTNYHVRQDEDGDLTHTLPEEPKTASELLLEFAAMVEFNYGTLREEPLAEGRTEEQAEVVRLIARRYLDVVAQNLGIDPPRLEHERGQVI